jgi:hypothetical protein
MEVEMRRPVGSLIVGATVVLILGSAPASGVTTVRKPMRIDAQAQGYQSCSGKFLLSYGTQLDGGKTECRYSWGADTKTSEGLPVSRFTQTLRFIGKAGTLDIASTGAVYDLAFGRAFAEEGTWRIVKGTEAYAGLHGSGIWRGAANRAQHSFSARFAALVSGP